MSKEVDEKVVSLQFENKNFESNARTSMSTLDKLKEKLNFKGASKYVNTLDSAIKKVDLSNISKGVDTAHSRFSALEVMGVTALANITNSAVNAGKKLAAAFTVEPIKTGFNEYELKMDSVRTIMASTGEDVKVVNKYLEELNEYSDQTIYSFSDMTQNIGKFTNAGVKLEDAVMAIKGISNEAAVSGANANEASRAMYNFAQALSAGYVKLIDWKSIELANMATVEFKNQLLEAAVGAGTLTKSADGMYTTLKGNTLSATKDFNESLNDQWMTTEVLVGTLKNYADNTTEIGKKAFAAAQDVTKFTQMMDVLKETAQSGWAKTWEIIFGDIEQAKAIFTPLTNFFSNLIDKMSDWRNNLLESALGKGFTHMLDGINKTFNGVNKTVETASTALGNLGKIVDDVILGKFGNGKDRVKALTEAGYNYYRVQNKVNETLSNSFRYSEKRIENQDKLLGIQTKTTEGAKEQTKATTELTKADKDQLKTLAALSDEQLKAKGYTDEQIAALRELRTQAEKLGLPLEEFIDNLDKINGRWLLMNSFKNIGQSIVTVFQSIGKAWSETFNPITGDHLFNIITAFHKFSANIKAAVGDGDKFRRTFKGIFALLDIVATVIAGPIKIAFKILQKLLGMFNIDIFELTARIGDVIVKFHDWLESVFDFTGILEVLMPYIKEGATRIRDWFAAFKNSDAVVKVSEYLKTAGERLKNWIDSLKESENLPRDIIAGLIKGLGKGVKLVGDAAIELGKRILNSIKNFLGIHSPSTKFMEVGKNIIAGLVQGLQNGASTVWETIKNIASKIVEFVKNIDFGKVFAAAFGVGMLYTVKKLIDVLGMFAAPLEGFGDMLEGIGDMFTGLGKNFKAKALERKSKALLNMAIAIGILAASVYVLSKLDTGKLWATIGALAALAAIVVALSFAASKMGNVDVNFGKQSIAILGISASLLVLAIAMKQLSTINGEDIPTTLMTFAMMIGGLSALMVIMGTFIKGKTAKNIDKAGIMMLKMSAALLLITFVMKQIAKLDGADIGKGLVVVLALETMFVAVAALSQFAGKNADKAGSMMLKMSIAFIGMITVIKLASKLKGAEVAKGIGVITLIGIVFAGLIAVSKFAGEHATKAGASLLLMSIAMGVTVFVIKQISSLEGDELKKGLGVIVMLGLVFAGLVAVTKIAGDNAIKAGVMLLMMAGSLVILTGVLFILGKINPSDLGRALAVVTVLELLFGGLIAVTKLAQDCKGTLITMIVAIGLLVAAVIGLTFIDPTKLATATAALSSVIIAFSLLVAATKYAKNAKSMIGPLAAMLGVVAGLALILTAMAKLEVEASMNNALALGVLLNAMTTALFILSKAGSVSMASVGALAVLGLVVAELAVILGLMDHFNVGASIETATSLSLLLGVMAGVLVVLSLVGSLASGAFAGIGAMALLGLVVGELALILGLMAHFDVNPSIETAKALSLLLLSMSGSLILLGVVGALGPAAFIGIGALATLIAGIGGLMVGIGALMDKFPQLQEFLDKGMPVIEQIGYAIGSFFGNVVGGFIGNVTSGLPEMANDLSTFMTNLQPFIDGAKAITAETMAGVNLLAETILVLTAADLLEGLTSWITGGSSLTSFAQELVPFGQAIADFSSTVSGKIDEGAVTAAANAGKLMAEMAAIAPNSGGLAGFIMGENDLSLFAQQLVPFGKAISQFSATVAGKVDETAVAAAASAGKIMTEMAKTIPNTGGLLAFLAGDNDLATFGLQLVVFGRAITNFSATVAGKVDETAVLAAANAGKLMSEMAKTIPNTGGLVSYFTGDNDLVTFGLQLVAFGKTITAFSKIVAGNIDSGAVEAAANAGMIMTSLANSIPKTGGLKALWSGNNDLATFGSKLVTFGEKMKSYSQKVAGIDTAQVANATTAFKSLVSLAKGTSGVKFDGLSSFGKALGKIGKDGVDNFVKTFKDSESKVNKAGGNLITYLIKGVEKGKSEVSKAFTTVASGATTALRDKYQSFYNAGSYLVDGFAAGISENDYKAEAKAAAMAKAAAEAAEKALDINSPSKVFRKIGGSVPEGFALGIEKLSGMVSGSTSSMTDGAVNTVKKAMSRLSNIINSDIDTQPTIRPVLDLSNVRSGASALSGMLSGGSLSLATSSVGAISASMTKIQNGRDTSELLSTIRGLRKDLANSPTNSYNFNGISYSEGTEVADAMQSLVRALKIERRV